MTTLSYDKPVVRFREQVPPRILCRRMLHRGIQATGVETHYARIVAARWEHPNKGPSALAVRLGVRRAVVAAVLVNEGLLPESELGGALSCGHSDWLDNGRVNLGAGAA